MEKSMINNKLRSVITLVDRLRDIQLESYIKLPKIVAVGSQSSGKSSLVQQVVGLDFLPRGSGVVTRRPLEIRMTYSHDLKQPYAQFQQLPKQKFTDFNEVKKSIEKLTDKVCGSDKNIVDNPIILNVFSSHCPNLTIIDLPGLTRIAVASQSANIHEVTSKMIHRYMVEPNTIILCVIPANQDITNDEVLMMARKIDVNGQRTVCCITKIDIMDRGTDARQLLLNKSEVQNKLGFFAIKNRSQADINQNKTVQYSLDEEKMFFSKSPIYSSLPPGVLGTASLVNTLTKVLSQSITKFLPELVSKIKQRKNQLAQIIRQYGKPLPKNPQEKQSLTWQLCNQYIRQLRKAISGEVTILKQRQRIQKVSVKITQDLASILDQQYSRDPGKMLTDQHIRFSMIKFQGTSMPGFPSINSFMYLIYPLIQKLRHPLELCLQNIADSLTHIGQLIISNIAHQFLTFREYMLAKTQEIFNIFRRKCLEFIDNIMQAQLNYIYTNNPLFDEYASRQHTEQQKKSDLAKQNPIIIVLRKRVEAYYKVIVKNLRDLIPKNIKHIMLNKAIDKLEFQIFQDSGFGSSKVDQWFKIGDSSMRQRLARQKQYDTIIKAEQFLLTHGGLADIRKGQLQKKRVLRQKQIKDHDTRKQTKRTQNTIQASPIQKEKSNGITVHNSIQKNRFPAKQEQKKVQIDNKKTYAQLFGDTKKVNTVAVKQAQPQKTVPSKGDLTDTYNQQAGKATDKAVDVMFKNQTFQKQSKKAVQNGASYAAQQQLGVGKETGDTLGKAVGWIYGQDATQNYIKQKTKQQAKNQTQIKK